MMSEEKRKNLELTLSSLSNEDKAWEQYDSEDGSTWFTSETEFRFDIMKTLQTLRDKGEFTNIIQTDYSEFLR